MSDIHNEIAINIVIAFLSGAIKNNTFNRMLARSGLCIEDIELIEKEIGSIVENIRHSPDLNARLEKYRNYLLSIGVNDAGIINTSTYQFGRILEAKYNERPLTELMPDTFLGISMKIEKDH